MTLYARIITLAAVLVALAVGAQAQTPEIDALRAQAEQGDAPAQNDLGVMYDTGRGVPQDEVEAVRWYRLAAEQGDAEAQHNLGVRYGTGEGVPQDDAEAVRWWRRAAEQGHATAQYNLGVMYANGRGVPQDDAEAVRWFRLAAEQGVAEAQYNLGNRYFDGRGVPQDDAEAVRWFRLALAIPSTPARQTRTSDAVCRRILRESSQCDGTIISKRRQGRPAGRVRNRFTP